MRLEGVGKRYGLRQPWVIRDVSLDLTAGRLVRVEGRNGTGKTTLLRVVAGVCVPSAGQITGRPHTGYVPERFPPALPFTARDYLVHMGRIHGLAGKTLTARIDEYLERLGAAHDASLPMRTMSKGMCQKVAVAQALLAQPGLLVLDEAWTGLDLAARDAIDGAVLERLADGGLVMFVDHDLRRLASVVDERWQIHAGLVTVSEGPGPVAAARPDDAPVAAIELSQASPELIAGLRRIPGVRNVSAEPGRTVVRADTDVSDDVLRILLADGRAHVLAVREETRMPS
ncbi:MAG TPA: ABC transporter ATP-binding protein [Streptosporangiaceae bacterium]|nr:ABC transporter ATP-binding protein [Streptosporangiaceae bacterium]